MALQQSLVRLIVDPHEEIAYTLGASLRGLNIKVKEDSYLMVVKITRRLDGNQVAFIEAPTCLGCWEYLHEHLHKTNAPLRWRADRW